MSLAEAIKETMSARGLQTAEVARKLGEGHDRATFYRLLSGATVEPRLGTLIGLCRVLEISPTELLQLAELWPHFERQADVLDVRLRDVFAQLQALPIEEKQRVVAVVSCVANIWSEPLDKGALHAADGNAENGGDTEDATDPPAYSVDGAS